MAQKVTNLLYCDYYADIIFLGNSDDDISVYNK